MKRAKFRKLVMTISPAGSYGHYVITATYKGREVTAVTTDAECYDYFDDDSVKEFHTHAKRHAYFKISNK